MKLFQLSISALVIRFYILMALVIIAGFTGMWFIAILALPVFMSCLMGIRFSSPVLSGRKKLPETEEYNTHHQHSTH